MEGHDPLTCELCHGEGVSAELVSLRAENDLLREELGYRPTAANGYCVACGCYMPQSLDGTKRVHGCNRTPPLGNLPTTIYACLVCGGHAPFAAGCWGTSGRSHEHIFMRPVHEIVAELRGASDDKQPAPPEGLSVGREQECGHCYQDSRCLFEPCPRPPKYPRGYDADADREWDEWEALKATLPSPRQEVPKEDR